MSLIAAPFAILAILYAGGFLAQLLGNYATWKQGGGIPGDGTSPAMALHRWPLRPTSFSAFPLCSDRLMACMAF